MNEIVAAFLVGALFGVCVGLTWALHLVERRAKRYKEAALHLTVTPEVVNRINAAVVTQWLDANGYCWMPKGREFTWPKEVKR